MLTDDDITKYQALYKAQFGKDIDKQTAREQLSRLVRQLEIVYQPITVHDLEDLIIEDAKKGVLNVPALRKYDEPNKKQALKQKHKKKA
ncbi:MAG TPA: hypothetical protein VMR18_00760 [Candidatus Saccharimonadales bacterium]|nr:hypothetical protein [Candidatus Saccharimonadales bacterium]